MEAYWLASFSSNGIERLNLLGRYIPKRVLAIRLVFIRKSRVYLFDAFAL